MVGLAAVMTWRGRNCTKPHDLPRMTQTFRTNLGLVLVRLGRIPEGVINFTKRYG